MSLLGLATVKGSTINVFRPTTTRTASGFSKYGWPGSPATTGGKGWIEPLSAELADRVFGSERRARFRVMLPLGTDVQEHDGLKVTAGRYNGKKYQVIGPLPYDQARRSDHIEVALLETTEAF